MRRTTALTRAFELALAAPAVIALRTARMAAAGGAPTAADRREALRMVDEKVTAFTRSWFAMAACQQCAQLEWWTAFAAYCWCLPWTIARAGGIVDAATARTILKRMQRSQAAVFAHGLAPLHRVATSNLRRLSATRGR